MVSWSDGLPAALVQDDKVLIEVTITRAAIGARQVQIARSRHMLHRL